MTNSELYPGLLTVIVILENSTVLLYEFLYKIRNSIVNYLFSLHKKFVKLPNNDFCSNHRINSILWL